MKVQGQPISYKFSKERQLRRTWRESSIILSIKSGTCRSNKWRIRSSLQHSLRKILLRLSKLSEILMSIHGMKAKIIKSNVDP
jgi:hypothetical protein